jgi:hypothetical protein
VEFAPWNGQAGLAWLVPVSFFVWYFLTPLGPERLPFVVASRAFDIDWHLRPRQQGTGFCFDASGLWIHAGLRRPINPEICLSQIAGPLAAAIPGVAGDHRGIEAGLACEEVFFTQMVVGKQRVGKVYSATDAAGHTTTVIECPPGYCFQRFDGDCPAEC